MSTITRKELNEYAKSVGADLLGIASIDRFNEVDKDKHPCTIFPETKSVIMVGKRITRGTLRGIEEGTQFDIYRVYGRDWLVNRILAMTTFQIAEFIEDNGWEAVPVPNLPSEVPPVGISVQPGQVAPNVMLDFNDAAVRAGLGEIGYLNILLTPEFGPLQRLQMILTSLELEADSINKAQICDNSQNHIDFCPLDAINSEDEQELDICGEKMKVAGIDYKKCESCENGAFPNPFHPAGKPDRLGAICVRNCLDYLEKNNKLKKEFKNPFRKKPAWQIVPERKIVQKKEV